MDLFRPKEDEREALQKHVHDLRLLDLRDNRMRSIRFAKAAGEGAMRIALFLEGSFQIGDVGLSEKVSLSSNIIPLIVGVIVGQYERAWISHMMTCLNEPISLQLSSDRYYGEIAKQLGNACFGRTTIL